MNPGKIICIGDIHGDFLVFKRVLQMCKLINNKDTWIGKDTYVVQLGDTLDGKRPGINISKEFIEESGEVEIIKYILYLDSQAKNFGGRVISIIGNHEVYPYYFENDKSFIRDYVKNIDILKYKKEYNISRNKFLKPGGLGASLIGRTRPLILQLGEFLFLHGSITNSLINNNIGTDGYVDIKKINNEVSLWLQGKGKIPKYFLEPNEDNPVFSRFYSDKKEIKQETCKKINQQIQKFKGVRYVIMGHSPYREINTACDGKLIRTDVALSRAFGGTIDNKKLQALEIINNGIDYVISIITEDKKISLQK